MHETAGIAQYLLHTAFSCKTVPQLIVLLENNVIWNSSDTKQTLKIGKHTDNDIILQDTRVSRNHAVIAQRDEMFHVYDNDSTNGTSVNSTPLVPKIWYPLPEKTCTISIVPYTLTCITNMHKGGRIIHLAEDLKKDSEATLPSHLSTRLMILHGETVLWNTYDNPKIIRIGRHENNDIILKDSRVSRNHAFIVKEKGKFYLIDHGSINGTYLDNKRILQRRPYVIPEEGLVSIPPFTLTYKVIQKVRKIYSAPEIFFKNTYQNYHLYL